MKADWKKVKLGEIATFSNGVNFGKESYTSGVKLIGVSNFGNKYFPEYDELEEINEKVLRENDYLKDGDIVFVRSNGNKELVGRCMLIQNPPSPVTYSGFCIRARLNDTENNNPRFFTYYFKSKIFRKSMSNSAVGANIQNLNQGLLSNHEIYLPPLETQKKIASILSAYDDLIENNRKQIKLLEEAAQRLYKEWFVDFRFPGYENVAIVDGVPDGWRKDSILSFDFFTQINPNVKKFEGEKFYYATADVNGTFLDGKGEKVTFSKRPSRASVQPCENSVWFARMSNSYKILCCFGKSNILASNSIISSGFAGFHSDEKYFGFIYTTIASGYFNQEKNRYATGATQVSLTNEGLRRISILVPTEDLIIKFSSIVNHIIKKSELLKNQIQLLQQARDKLLLRLMSGEMEV